MCGINLIIDKKKVLSPNVINKMSVITRHRGPDESNSTVLNSKAGTIFIAANRLKITDQTDAASQPFLSKNSKYALLFNGEIYNFQSLKNELLDHKIRFTSHSDTEVLFHWLMLKGKDGFDKLEGMFAIVFIDIEQNKVLIARDRYGIKPFYYYENERYFIGSSEIKSIINSGLVNYELNASQINHYFQFKYVEPPETLYKNIFELTHGKILSIHGNKIKIESFFKTKESIKASNPDVDIVEELITNSLIQQINTKVPLGLLLSGGVDSTLLLALAHKEGFTLPTYSIVNSEADSSYGTKDYIYSRLAASTYNSEHHELEIDISLLDNFDNFIEKLDQPIGDSSLLMTSEISNYASKSQPYQRVGMRILLSGAGADELFAGYNRHWAYFNYLKYQGLLKKLQPLISPVSKSLPTGFPHPIRKQFKLLRKWSDAYDISPRQTFINYLSFSEFKEKKPQKDNGADDQNQHDLMNWALKHDRNHYLISDVLALSDKATMLHGVEMRVPYINKELIDYLDRIHTSQLLLKGQKWILKEILKKNGGKKFISRSKEGFGLPLGNWLFNLKIAHLWELFENSESVIFKYIGMEKFKLIADRHKRKAEDHGPLLWSILVLGHWLEKNFG